MSRGNDHSQWTAEQTLSYITGMVAAADNQDEEEYNQTLYTALSISYEYLTNSIKKKITWSISLQKLAYEFIQLAFLTNMHASIKDVFKSYRSLTQGQYSQSLKDVLVYYRDKKLEAILEQEISEEDLQIIQGMPNIQSDQMSSEVILSSFKPQLKLKLVTLKNKLRIVWEGYKSIVQTVRVNQKLQSVYMDTLRKIFDFVDRYNRKHQFKIFCKTLRSGLQNAFNKRDKSEQQKAIYIDIEKKEVNDRNIDIRMEQFKITTKLGLWQEAFQVLEDINNLMTVRKAPLKNKIRSMYYLNLALLFKKSNYWHYHAFAYYNYYTAFLTNPKITVEEKRNISDKLLLAVLCIPPATIESHQSKESQQKICSMMISSTKIPDKNQLFQMMVSKGIVQSSSNSVKQLWNFMFLEFNLSSLNRGLDLLKGLSAENEEFKELIQNILIYKQLISIAQVYQRIKMQSLLRLIPLPKENIEKILILCHHQKIIDFSFDESQGIIIFEDKSEQINPYDELLDIFIDISITRQKERNLDAPFIKKKAATFVDQAEEYFWKIRQYKIDEFKKKMKKPKQELLNRQRQREREEKQLKEKIEIERKIKEAELIKKNQELQKILATKKIIIDDIIAAKQQRIVRILGKKVQNLTDQQIENLSVEVLSEHLEAIRKKISNNKEAKFKKAFTQVDYFERERRVLLDQKIKQKILTKEQQQEQIKQISIVAQKDFQERKDQRNRLLQVAKYLKTKIDGQLQIVNAKYDQQLEQFSNKLKQNFKDKIIAKAMAISAQNQQRKKENLMRTLEQQKEYEDLNGKWSFKGLSTKDKEASKSSDIVIGGKKEAGSSSYTKAEQPAFTIGKKSNNIYEKLEGVDQEEEKKTSTWRIGSKLGSQPEKKDTTTEIKRQKREEPVNNDPWKKKQVPAPTINPIVPPVQQATSFQPAKKQEKGWGKKGFVNVNSDKREQPPKKQEKKQEKKEEKKEGTGRKFI